MTGSILGFSLPNFWQGMMLIMIFSVWLGWLPSTGRGELGTIFGIRTSLATWSGLSHLILPALGTRFTDFQTVELDRNDRGWTTRGLPEGRAGGLGTYEAPHIRERDHFADPALTVAMRFEPADEEPTLETIAAALDEPARPLFLGRKACPPTRPLNGGFVDAMDLAEALARSLEAGTRPLAILPDGPDIDPRWERLVVSDRRDWISGVHAGSRIFRRGRLGAGS